MGVSTDISDCVNLNLVCLLLFVVDTVNTDTLALGITTVQVDGTGLTVGRHNDETCHGRS